MMIGEGMHRDCTHVGETAHCVERPSLNSAAVSLQRARLIQNANLTDINVGTATCLRMEQKCLLFFFSTLRSNL